MLDFQKQGAKVCSKCGNELPTTLFYKDSRREDGLRSVCKLCWSQRQKAYRIAHKDEIVESGKQYYRSNKEQIGQRVRKWKSDNHEKLMDQQRARRQSAADQITTLKTPCVKCGDERPWVIQFHHIDPSEKEFEINVEKIMFRHTAHVEAEAKKCACLCANCHTEFHHFFGKNPKEPRAAFDEYIGGETDERYTGSSRD